MVADTTEPSPDTPMQSTTHSTRRAVNPRLPMARGQEEAVLDAYCALFGGKEASDDRYIGGASALLPLRVAARAMLAGVPKAKVITYYLTLLAEVEASYPADDDDERTIREIMLEEQRANCALDCEQMTLGEQPTRAALLTLAKKCDEQIEKTLTIKQRCTRMLGRVQDVVRSGQTAQRRWV